ncbi:MAG: ThiF family adenylyltransferase [Salibacteraceae bacterium]
MEMNENTYYNRQLKLNEIGEAGQLKLKNASVLVIGAGGLGTSALTSLVLSGVGHVGICDFDRVEESNLHRQELFSFNDIGLLKVEAAKKRLLAQNPSVKITLHSNGLTYTEALKTISKYDLVLDCTDQIGLRYLINDVCLMQGKPWVSAAIHGFKGQLATFNYKSSGTYRCLFPNKPQETVTDCNENGVLSPTPSILGHWQALEAIKIIIDTSINYENTELNILNIIDLTNISIQKIKFERDKIATKKRILTGLDSEQFYGITCKTESEVSWNELNSNQTLIDVRELNEEKFNPKSFQIIRIPLSELEKSQSKLSEIESYIFFCQSGVRSLKALEITKNKLNKTHVKHITGGINAYPIH